MRTSNSNGLLFDTQYVNCFVRKMENDDSLRDSYYDETSSNPCNSDDSIVEKKSQARKKLKLKKKSFYLDSTLSQSLSQSSNSQQDLMNLSIKDLQYANINNTNNTLTDQISGNTSVKNNFEIKLEKIMEDGRSTLMIKNIPNKYDQEMVLEKIDQQFKNKYDFFYLPIDFNNKCNMGYAFINFNELDTLVKFYQKFNNHKWQQFNSEKICKLSYARIQGKQGCIRHFEQSRIMNEKDQKVRPIFFYESIQRLVEKQRQFCLD